MNKRGFELAPQQLIIIVITTIVFIILLGMYLWQSGFAADFLPGLPNIIR